MRGEAGWRQRNVHQGLKRQLTDSKTEPNVGTLWSEGEHTPKPVGTCLIFPTIF